MKKLKLDHSKPTNYEAIFGTEEAGDAFMQKFTNMVRDAFYELKDAKKSISPSRLYEMVVDRMTEEEKETYLAVCMAGDISQILDRHASCDCPVCIAKRAQKDIISVEINPRKPQGDC
jgi:hypothetical protein